MIYVHVPFCASRCTYCDFYSTTGGAEQRQAYVKVLKEEIKARAHELKKVRQSGQEDGVPLRSIYFGGGTPSRLTAEEIEEILDTVRQFYSLDDATEVTLEANPDDLTDSFVSALKKMGINRVSLGVQTFNDDLLKVIHRRHDAATAVRAVERLQRAGIRNISLDLIYSLPLQTLESFQHDVRTALSLGVPHLSAYALMVAEGTVMARRIDAHELTLPDEETVLKEYDTLCEMTAAAGMEHYEISNFALPNFHSRHNSGYWDTEVAYVGLGPGAHSFRPASEDAPWGVRRHNLSDLNAWLKRPGQPPFQEEVLTEEDAFNETVMTALRTSAGLNLQKLEQHFSPRRLERLLQDAHVHLKRGTLCLTGQHLRLPEASFPVSNDVISDLFQVE